jgi:hypothetical protein
LEEKLNAEKEQAVESMEVLSSIEGEFKTQKKEHDSIEQVLLSTLPV